MKVEGTVRKILACLPWLIVSCGSSPEPEAPSPAGGAGTSGDSGASGWRTATPIGPASALLPAGAWLDRTPCPTPSAWGGAEYDRWITFDGRGRLFCLSPSFSDAMPNTLWEWDAGLRRFAARTPCVPPQIWPWFQQGMFTYDPVQDALLAVGGRNSDPDMLYQMSIGSDEWTAQTVDSWSIGDYAGAKLVRDERRHSVILVSNTAFERRDGAREWTLFPQVNVPPNQAYPTERGPVAYDPVRGKLLTVVGTSQFSTWELDIAGSRWTDWTATAGQLAGESPVLWWDPVASRIGMLTIARDPGGQPKVWAWDGGTAVWSAQTASGSLSPTIGWIFDWAVDPTSGDVAFWVHPPSKAGGPDQFELWRWGAKAQVWTQLSPERWPRLWPTAEYSSTAAYDSDRDRLVVVTAPEPGGRVEVTEWDRVSETFTERTGLDTDPWPTDMLEMDAVYDPDRHHLLLLGKTPYEGELWEWDGSTGLWRTRTPKGASAGALIGAGWPSDISASIAYDWTRHQLAAFLFPFLFRWDPDSDVWQAETLPADIVVPNSSHTKLIADQRRGRLVLVSTGPTIAEWDGSTWTQANVPKQPDLGIRLLAAFDPRGGKTLMLTVQEITHDSTNRTFQNDLLSWDGEQLVRITPPDLASVRFDDFPVGGALVYDTSRGNLLLVGVGAASRENTISTGGMRVWEGSTAPAL